MGQFATEAALCEAFIAALPEGWTPYPETAGFDLVLVNDATGVQIAIEAKLRLNAKVICQVMDEVTDRGNVGAPDFRAVLVDTCSAEFERICVRLGITVLRLRPNKMHGYRANTTEWEIRPRLPVPRRLSEPQPGWLHEAEWHDLAPLSRIELPDYVPQVAAGVKSPKVLSHWMIKAFRVCAWVERHGTIKRSHFAALGISPTMWMTGHMLKQGEGRGEWVAGRRFPLQSYKARHPGIYEQVLADYDDWAAPLEALQAA
jgi:hypothetical protein